MEHVSPTVLGDLAAATPSSQSVASTAGSATSHRKRSRPAERTEVDPGPGQSPGYVTGSGAPGSVQRPKKPKVKRLVFCLVFCP